MVIHNSVKWSLCVHDKSMPPLYDQKHMLPIRLTAQFLFSQPLLVPENPLAFIPRLDSPLPLSALNQNNHVYPVPFISPVVPWFPECDLGISSTHETWPALCSGVAYILLSRVTVALRLHQAKHPVPRLVTHIPGVFSIWLPLVLSPKRRGIYTGPFRKSNIRSNMNNMEARWGVLPLRALPLGALFPFRFSVTLLFPRTPQLPLTSAQQTNTITPPVNDISLFSGPRELSRLQGETGA